MDLGKVWSEESLIIEECIATIKYDEVLVETLRKVKSDMEESIVKEIDISEDLTVIISVLESQRYMAEVLSKASDVERKLVEKLLQSMYLLHTIIKSCNYKTKETYLKKTAYTYTGGVSFNSDINDVDKYKQMWEKIEMKDYNVDNKFNKYRL